MFSLSGKSKNQIPCFPCAVACLYGHDIDDNEQFDQHKMYNEEMMRLGHEQVGFRINGRKAASKCEGQEQVQAGMSRSK